MIVNNIAVSSLTIGQTYANLKLNYLQRGVLAGFVVNSVDSNGDFEVTLTYADGSITNTTMASDQIVFEVDDELLSFIPID